MRTVRRWIWQRDSEVLAEKDDIPHCVFHGNEAITIFNVKREVIACLERVAICDDGNRIAYDEMLRFERGGSIFLPVTPEGLVGMRKVWRPQTTDPQYREKFPNVDLGQLGQMTWDICGGYGDPGTTPEQAARIEAEEESRCPVVDVEYLGKTVINRGNDAHFTHLFWGTLDLTKPTMTAKDLLEKNKGNMHFFSQAQCLELFNGGMLYDQCVISALWAFEKKYPGRLA